MTTNQSFGIPRPLVRINQWMIVLAVVTFGLSREIWPLYVPLAVGILGVLVNWNPVMWIGRFFLNREHVYTMEDRDQQKFNQYISIILLALAVTSDAIGLRLVAAIFAAFVGAAAFVAILGFCVGCFIRFQWQQFQYRRHLHSEK